MENDKGLNKHDSCMSPTSDPALDDPYTPVVVSDLVAAYELFCSFARNIAMLPLEDWLEQFEKAETVCPVLDPTLYREYIYSEKVAILKDLIRKAIPLKQAVLAAEPAARRAAQGLETLPDPRIQREPGTGSSTATARARSNPKPL